MRLITKAELSSIVVVATALLAISCQGTPNAGTADAKTGRADLGTQSRRIAVVRSEPCPEEANAAVLNKLYPLLSRQIDVATTEMALQKSASDLQCIRDWAVTLDDSCIRNEYVLWLDYYSGEIDRKRKELANDGKAESDSEKWRRERRDEDRKVAAYEASHDVPKPPSCDLKIVRNAK